MKVSFVVLNAYPLCPTALGLETLCFVSWKGTGRLPWCRHHRQSHHFNPSWKLFDPSWSKRNIRKILRSLRSLRSTWWGHYLIIHPLFSHGASRCRLGLVWGERQQGDRRMVQWSGGGEKHPETSRNRLRKKMEKNDGNRWDNRLEMMEIDAKLESDVYTFAVHLWIPSVSPRVFLPFFSGFFGRFFGWERHSGDIADPWHHRWDHHRLWGFRPKVGPERPRQTDSTGRSFSGMK